MKRPHLFYPLAISVLIFSNNSFATNYPTGFPPSSFANNITVRGVEYTAIGYDYSDILEYGQEFQNCVFDAATGYLHVIDNNNDDQGGDVGFTDQILTIDPANGTVLSAFNLPLATDYSFCLTIGKNNNLFFAERNGTPIYEITTAGTVVDQHNIDTIPPSDWPGVQRDGIGFNPNTNTYYITEGNFSRVTLDATGSFIKHESYDTITQDCLAPRGIVYEANNNSLLIIDDSSDQVYEFGLDGAFIAGGGESTRTVEMPEDITHANGIAFDPATGRIFITGMRWRTEDPVKRAKLVVLTPVDPVVPVVTGDMDGNGVININDYYELISCRNKLAEACPGADINGDGVVTLADARILILSCDRPRCATQECFSFNQESPTLDVSHQMTQIAPQSFLKYTAGPDHSTSIFFDLHLDDSLFANVGPVPVGGSSGFIALPAQVGNHDIGLVDVVCPTDLGSCIDGTVSSWGGTVCITP